MRAVLLREGNRLRIIAPYSPAFVSELKAEIPYHARTWDQEDRTWLVDGDYEEPLLEVAEHAFDVTLALSEIEARQRERAARASAAPPPPQPPHDTTECARRVRQVWQEEAELYLLPGAPLRVVQAAYRALSLLLHPDVAGSGSTAAMVKLNHAYDVLTRRAGGGTA